MAETATGADGIGARAGQGELVSGNARGSAGTTKKGRRGDSISAGAETGPEETASVIHRGVCHAAAAVTEAATQTSTQLVDGDRQVRKQHRGCAQGGCSDAAKLSATVLEVSAVPRTLTKLGSCAMCSC